MIDYIHASPVGRGLVATAPEEWEWSSVRWYAGVEYKKANRRRDRRDDGVRIS